jgi:uncharacterized membrane protein (GlpM family)
MSDFFKYLLAFGVGGFMVTLVTVAAEKAGSKIGGLIGGLPTMVAISLFFIGLVQTPRAAAEATNVIPLTMGFNGVFLVVYAALAKWGAWFGLAGAFLAWAILSSIVLLLDIQSFPFSLLVFILLLGLCFFTIEKKLNLSSSGQLNTRYTPSQIAARAVFSGSVVALAVFLSKLGGPIWGGIFAPFPAVYLSTLIIMAKSKGVESSRKITKSLLVSGMINVVAYAAAVRFFYISFGLAVGTMMALAISAVSAYGTYVFMRERMT